MQLFVYGTLKQGQPRAYILQDLNAQFLGDATVSDYELRFVEEGDFPALVKFNTERRVVGELYRAEQDLIRTLNVVESVPHLFRLEQVTEYTLAYVLHKPERFTLSMKGVYDDGIYQRWSAYEPNPSF